MNRKLLILGTVLAIGVTVFGRGWPARGQVPDQSQPATRNMVQRSLFRECELTAQQARRHLDELARGVRQGHSQASEVQPHLAEVRGSVSAMLEDHRRFLKNLTEQQWTTGKGSITKLEMLRASLNSDLEGMDIELKMPAPDPKVLMRYVKKTDRALREWKKEHRSLGAAAGITRRGETI